MEHHYYERQKDAVLVCNCERQSDQSLCKIGIKTASVGHNIKSAMHCLLRLAPTMINHLTSILYLIVGGGVTLKFGKP